MTPDIHPDSVDLDALLRDVRGCALCPDLPLGPRPLLQLGHGARILVVGQAPGRRTHAAGRPFDDVSGDRLRDWMGIDRTTFYDPAKLAIIPMGMCYPGTGRSGDLPPRAECAPAWRERLIAAAPDVGLTLAIGQYAIDWHIRRVEGRRGGSLADIVADWRSYWPRLLPLPHPSPRNNRWLRERPWFEAEVVPVLRQRVAELLG